MSDVQEHPLYKRALECTTEELDLKGEFVCLAACGAGLCAFRSGWHASFGRWSVRARAKWRAWVALLNADRLRVSCCFWCAGWTRQGTASATQVQWRLPRHWRAGSASCRASISHVSLCVLPRALLGAAPFAPAGMLSVGGVRACGVEGVGGAFGC